jgi:hypothetical protein
MAVPSIFFSFGFYSCPHAKKSKYCILFLSLLSCKKKTTRKREMEDATIALPTFSLMNLVSAAFGDENPQQYMCHLLQPYHITAEQVEELASLLHWPGRPHCSHPCYALVRGIGDYTSVEQRKCLNAINKQRFIHVATSVSHIWICKAATKKGGGIRRICTYQGENAPIPFAWLHIDRQGMIQCARMSNKMPCLAITVNRYCAMGKLLPLELDFNNEARGLANGCCYLRVYMDVNDDNAAFDVSCWASDDMNDNKNFALLFTRSAEICTLKRAFLVSPSLRRTWTLPIMIHEIKPDD